LSIFDRWFKPKLTAPAATQEPAQADKQPPSQTRAATVTPRDDADEAPIEANSVGDILRIEETAGAEFYIGDLFRRRFGSDPPDFPRHYVAFYRQARARYLPVGYVHFTPFEDMYLGGGMVIDERLYRRMPAPHRKLIKDAGGIAETMLRETLSRLSHAPAVWGYVGDKRAEEVDLRAGFRRTEHPYVVVVWNGELSDEEKAARLQRVIALGPF
jgi:hypothetical protein